MKAPAWSEQELLVAKTKDKLTITSWSERKRVLTNAAIRGPYQSAMVPFLAPVMDAFADPDVETVVFCKSAQIGGTDAMLNVLGYFIDQEPSSIMLVLADEDTAIQEMSRRRVQPMFAESPDLAHLPDPDMWTKKELSFINGARLTFGWASSVPRLASRPFRIVVCDEIDKQGYELATTEGDAIGLAKERTNTFANRKIGLLSTPTIDTGRIAREMAACDVVYDWHVPCPDCGQFQPLRWSVKYAGTIAHDGKYRAEDGTWRNLGLVTWEGGREAASEQIEAAAYQCGECGSSWDTVAKNRAVQSGRMVPRSETPSRARKVGYHINRLYSLFPGGRLENLVSDWIGAVKSGDVRQIQGFVNSSLGEPWKQVVVESSAGAVLKARVDLPPRTVPTEAVLLTCGIDNQLTGRWYVVRAWAPDYTSWLVDYGHLATWEELESLLFEARYPHQNGSPMGIWRAAIDTGGGAQESGISMTEEVYWWVRKHRGKHPHVWPVKGHAGAMPTRIKAGKPIEKTPSGKPIQGGLQIVSLDTGAIKDVIHYRLQKALEGNGEPQSAYLHAEVGEDYAQQIGAEEKQIDRKGNEQWVQIRRSNHLLDAEVYTHALVDPEWPAGGLNLYRERASTQRPASRPQPSTNPYTQGHNPYAR